MGMLPVPSSLSSILPAHPPSFLFIFQGFAWASGWGSLPQFPCPIFLPGYSPLVCQPLPLLFSPPPVFSED